MDGNDNIKHSDNNSDNSNISDNDNNNLTSLLPLDVFFVLSLNAFQLTFLSTEIGNLFHADGPLYERSFCSMLLFRKKI